MIDGRFTKQILRGLDTKPLVRIVEKHWNNLAELIDHFCLRKGRVIDSCARTVSIALERLKAG